MEGSALRIGVVGFGFWGTKLARNVVDADGSALAAICDSSPERRAAAAQRHAGVATFGDLGALLAAPDLDALVLASPAAEHHAQAKAALFAGKHVLVEKPLTLTVADCDELERLATARGLTLMAGHTFLYSAPVQALRELVRSGELGDILYCYAQRLNLGALRDDTGAMWDLAPHDVSIFLHLLDARPAMVSAQQFSLIDQAQPDIAFLTLAFPGGSVAHLHVSRLDPRKVRQLTVVGGRKMAVYDDTDAETPLRIYDKGVTWTDQYLEQGFGQHRLEVRTGDMVAPKIGGSEPLRVEVEDFVGAIRERRPPVADAHSGRDVVAVLEAAGRSSAHGGEPMAVEEASARARAAA